MKRRGLEIVNKIYSTMIENEKGNVLLNRSVKPQKPEIRQKAEKSIQKGVKDE